MTNSKPARKPALTLPDKWTDATVAKLARDAKAAPPTKDIQKTILPGLFLRVTTGGSVLFYFSYKDDGRTKRIPLGGVPDSTFREVMARLKAMQEAREAGDDPADLREGSAPEKIPTVGEVLAQHRSRYADPDTWERTLRLPLQDLAHLRADRLTPKGMKAYIEENYSTAGAAAAVIRIMRAAYSLAMDPLADVRLPAGMANPLSMLERHIPLIAEHEKQGYARSYSDDEYGRLLHTLADFIENPRLGLPHPLGYVALKLLALTGARPSEILTAKREDIITERFGANQTATYILKRDHKTKKKVNISRKIYLNDLAIQCVNKAIELGDAFGYDKNPYVFPSIPAGRKPKHRIVPSHIEGHIPRLNHWLPPLREAMGDPTLSAYSMRSVFINATIDAGVDIVAVADAVGHADIKTTRRHYSRANTQRLTGAVDALSERVKRITQADADAD